jgi:hypothetical protein
MTAFRALRAAPRASVRDVTSAPRRWQHPPVADPSMHRPQLPFTVRMEEGRQGGGGIAMSGLVRGGAPAAPFQKHLPCPGGAAKRKARRRHGDVSANNAPDSVVERWGMDFDPEFDPLSAGPEVRQPSIRPPGAPNEPGRGRRLTAMAAPITCSGDPHSRKCSVLSRCLGDSVFRPASLQ